MPPPAYAVFPLIVQFSRSGAEFTSYNPPPSPVDVFPLIVQSLITIDAALR